MKISEYHKAHGLSGVLRAFDSNTEIHFTFEKGKTRTGVELNLGGHIVEGYLEITGVPTKDPNAEFDVALSLLVGPRPAQDYQPNPRSVGGNKGLVATPEPTYELPPAPPGMVPIAEKKTEPAKYEPVDRFDPGPPPPPPEPAEVDEPEPETAKLAVILTPEEVRKREQQGQKEQQGQGQKSQKAQKAQKGR
jgi:hypothetical protein